MRKSRPFLLSFSLFVSVALLAVISVLAQHSVPAPNTISGSRVRHVSGSPSNTPAHVTEASLTIVDKNGAAGFCPLRHTDVKAGISGFLARVVVSQEFANPSTENIEAVYTFPLPVQAAVDDMTIRVGGREIRGLIKKREEAAAIYREAIRQGHTAALLDQERPNIFTQTVGNIPPGQTVRITISYVERLKYEDGAYEFSFPMVVGPRYIPGTVATGHQGGGWAPDTDKVPDASRITPSVAPPGTRAGHDISLSVALDAGVPIQDLRSNTHPIDVDRTGATSAMVRLRNASEIPNKDFVLRYDVAGTSIAEGLLAHASVTPSARLVPASGRTSGISTSQTDGYFTLILQPPDRFPDSDVTPKEIVFVLDSSGSMNGFPVEKSKQFIDYALGGLYPGDTFNVIKFSGDTDILFPQPVYPSAGNVRRAREFVNADWGHGGTEMMKAIRAALAPSDSPDHLRVVVFLTDGYVGNDMEIVGEIQKHSNARVFAFGVGSSVNRFLLDKMAEAGRGEVEYVSARQDQQEGEAAVHRLYERLRAPLLTDIALDFGSLPVTDIYPSHIPDLFSGKPVVVTGRYTSVARGTVRLTGKRAGDAYSRQISVSLPAQSDANPVLATLWAREKIDDLMSQDWAGLQQGSMRPALVSEITQLGLDYRLMTQFTSFVAVEERTINDGGTPRRIEVPVEIPEGVSYEGIFGEKKEMSSTSQNVAVSALASPMVVFKNVAPPPPASAAVVGGVAGGVPGGQMGGVVGGIVATNNVPANATSSRDRLDIGKSAAVGSGSGGGVGAGSGPGVGPGRGGGVGGGVYRVGGALSAPRAISSPDPTCPAAQVKCTGKVVLYAIISPDGHPQQISVARSAGDALDRRAIAAVRKWKFQPATKDGRPVAVQVNVEVNFAAGSHAIAMAGTATAGTTSSATMSGTNPTPAHRAIDGKLSAELVTAYDCWQKHPDKSHATEACKLKGERVAVVVIGSGDNSALLAKLKTLGFREDAKTSYRNRMSGSIAVEKLAALADVKEVQFVAPAETKSARSGH